MARVRNAPRGLGLALTVAAVGWAAGAGQKPTSTPTLGLHDHTVSWLAFTHATVVISPEKTVANATLVVRDGRVEAVGADLPVPAGALEVDLGGRRVLPGFLDLVTEYGLPTPPKKEGEGRGSRNRAPQYEGNRQGANAWNDALRPEREWVGDFRPDEKAAEKLAKLGVTAVGSAKMDGILRGRGFLASLAPGLPNDVLLTPLGPHYASFDKGSSHQEYPSSLMGSIALLRQTFLDARWYASAQTAFNKNPLQEKPETNRALAALADYHGPLLFETRDELSLLRAARLAREVGIELVPIGSLLEHTRVAEVAALGRPLILPLSFPKAPNVATYEDSLDVRLVDLRHWERAPSTPALLDEAGVRLAFTTRGLRADEDFWQNLRRTIARGLPEAKAVAALTTVPAEIAGLSRELGTLEPGKRADFLVLDGNPFQEEADLVAVYIAGRPRLTLEPLARFDFRGGWGFQLDGTRYEFSLSGEPDQPEGTLFVGKKEISLDHLEADGELLTFTAALTPDTVPARFRLEAHAGGVTGRVSREAGEPEPLALTRLAKVRQPALGQRDGKEGKNNEDNDESLWEHFDSERFEALDKEPLSSRSTFPNAAYGFSEVPKATAVLVRGATVWTGAQAGVLEATDLLVEGGKIVAIGKGLAAPAGAVVIDAHGKHVTAGAIDEHSHLAISDGVNEGSHAITSEVRIGDVLDPDDIGIYRALAGGTTSMQLLHGSANPIGGQAQVVKLRWGATAEGMKFDAAPPSIKFALGENVKQSNWGPEAVTRYPQTRMGVDSLMKDAFLAARLNQEEWKRWQALSPAQREATVPPRRDLTLEALAEILDSKRFVHCHSYVQSEILAMMRLAEELGFTLQTFTHILDGYKVAPEMAKHGAGGSSFSDWWGYKFEVYDAIPYNTCLLHEAGVVTSINSDSADLIRRLFHEAAKSVFYCGMDEHEALKLATLNPAKQLKIDHRVGSLETGKDADFVLWGGPPLSVYSRVEQTFVDGVLMFDRQRDQELARADAAERAALIEKALSIADGEFGDGDYSHRRGQREWHCEDIEDVWEARNEH